MGTAILTGEVVLFALLVGFLLFVSITLVRRRLIGRDSALVLCVLRLTGARWHTGMLKLTPSALLWYPLFGVTTRARHYWRRGALDVDRVGPLEPESSPAFAGVSAPMRVDFTVSSRTSSSEPEAFQLGLSAENYTAIRAWLEAGPPMDWRVET